MPRASSVARVCGPDFEVFAAVARRGVHEAGAGVVGDVVASEKRNVEIVAFAAQEDGADHALQDRRPERRSTFS